MNTVQTIQVLMIEDCDVDCSLIGSMMKDSDTTHFQIDTARSLSLGIARLAEKKFDAVILDLGLPGSNGMDTLKKFSRIIWKCLSLFSQK